MYEGLTQRFFHGIRERLFHMGKMAGAWNWPLICNGAAKNAWSFTALRSYVQY
jgi:hypothetical protein